MDGVHLRMEIEVITLTQIYLFHSEIFALWLSANGEKLYAKERVIFMYLKALCVFSVILQVSLIFVNIQCKNY